LPWKPDMRSDKIITGILLFVVLACLAGCTAHERVRTTQYPTIAVWDLENLTPADQAHPDLGEVLAGRVIETIKASGKATVVERQRLLLALEELNLGASSLVDQDTRLDVGKMLGARFMVFGAYQVIAGTMRLDLRLVEVETGKIVNVAGRICPGGDMSAWLNAAEAAAKDL